MKILSRCLQGFWCLGMVWSCGQPAAQNTLKESWNAPNTPSRMGSYTFAFDRLPTEGQHKNPVWSGDYWPSYQGGAAQRWQVKTGLFDSSAYPLLEQDGWRVADLKMLSPTEKYDIYAGHYDFPLTRFERERTRVLSSIFGTDRYIPGFVIPSWEGLCHGWAPATISYAEPQPVTVLNPEGIEIPFGSADIKALLSLLMDEQQGSVTRFLGRRCEADFAKLQRDLALGRITQATYDREVNSLACRDTNAGSFHIVLSNELGLNHNAFLADIRRDQEVWNQGFFSYSSVLGAVMQQRSPGAARETVYEVNVKTVVQYIQEVPSAWEAQASKDGQIFDWVEYSYRLELNAAREVVGGAWLSLDRPDFLWGLSPPTGSSLMDHLPEVFQASTGTALFP